MTEHDEEGQETEEGTEEPEAGYLDPPKTGNGLGAQPQPVQPQAEQPAAAPKKGGRPKGSRNRTAEERDQAAATGVGAPTMRPAGATGQFPGEEGKIPNDADLMWPYILEEIQKAGYSPYDMEIRVERKTPLPAVPMLTFDASSVIGDSSMSPATALRSFIENWIHLPSGIGGPALYVVYFCWRNKAQFFRRGEMKVGSRNEILAMQQSTAARQAQSGAAGVGAIPHFQPPQQQQQQQHYPPPQQQQYAQPYYPGFGAPPPQQQPAPQQPHFDADAERAKIRAELEREQELRDLRRELDDLRRRPQYAPPPPQYAQPQQPQRRGAGAPPPPQPYYPETEDDRIARVVVSVLQQTGVVPRQGQQPTGVGATPPTLGQTQTMDFVDNMERGLEMAERTKKVLARASSVFGGQAPPPKGAGAAPAAEDEEKEKVPKVRFQPTGQKYKGHDTMIPVDENDEPIIPTTLPMILATGIANPFLLEPIAVGMGAILTQGAQMMKGLGAQPQQQPQRADIHVQQVQPQQQQQAPAPTPYYPPQQMQQPAPQAPPAAPDDGGWST